MLKINFLVQLVHIKRKSRTLLQILNISLRPPKEFIKKDIEVPETIQVGELAKLMAVKGGEVVKNLNEPWNCSHNKRHH